MSEQELWLVIVNQWDDEVRVRDLETQEIDEMIEKSESLIKDLKQLRDSKDSGGAE